MVDFLFLEQPPMDPDALAKAMKPEWAAQLLRDVVGVFAACDWQHDVLKTELEKIGEIHGVKLGKAQAPVRVAVTGRSVGPPLFESLELLGRDRTLARLKAILG
jgi:glutamyl-tRNA synthetase